MLSVLGKNLPFKILSIILAVFLWAIISRGQGGESMEVSIGVPLELHNLPPEMEVVKGPVERVDVRLSGPRRSVSRISHLGISIPLDLKGAMEGETTFEIFTSDIKVPERITVTRVSPSSVTVYLERTVRKKVSIKVPVTGTPDSGYQAGVVEVKPDSMDIKGPRSQVGRIKYLETAPVNIDGARDDVTGETAVVLSEETAIHALSRSRIEYRVPVRAVNQTGKKP